MKDRKHIVVVALAGLLLGVAALGVAQVESTPAPDTASAAGVVDQVLTFIDSASTYLGKGLLYVLNLITKDRLSAELEKPLGYLAFITLLLIVFGLIDFARKVIWVGIVVGWVLLIVRIVLDALKV
ncbi:MAG: hypothetical protein AB1778_03885 [Candidatus Bipolaricaulota bacterium]